MAVVPAPKAPSAPNPTDQATANPSVPAQPNVTPTPKGYAYTDKYGFSHVVGDLNTAQEYGQSGSIEGYNGNFGGGYALDSNGNRMAVQTPGAVAYGNDIRDGIQTNWSTSGLVAPINGGSAVPAPTTGSVATQPRAVDGVSTTVSAVPTTINGTGQSVQQSVAPVVPPTSPMDAGTPGDLNDPTKKLMADIGRSQSAYWQYVQAGRPDLAQGASQWANKDRTQLGAMGVNPNLYKQGVDLRNLWTGGTPGSFDPSQKGQVPVGSVPQAPQSSQSSSVPPPQDLYTPMTMDQIKAQAHAEIAQKIAQKQQEAAATKAQLQSDYGYETNKLKDNRTLEDWKFGETHNPYSGGTDYQKAMLSHDRSNQDTTMARDLANKLAGIDNNLNSFTSDEQSQEQARVDQLIRDERNFKLETDKFSLDKDNTKFNQNLETQKLNDTEAAQNGQMTGNYVNPKVSQLANQVIADKQAWAQTNDPSQQAKIAQDAVNLRQTLASYGINADKLFGSNVPLEQSLKNMGQLGTPTLSARELGLKNQQFQFDKQLQTNELNLKNQQFQFDQNKWAQEFSFNKDEKAKADQLEQERINQQGDYQGWLKQKGINEQQAGKATNGYAGEIISKIGAGDITSREEAYKYITDHQSDISKDGADINKLMGIIDQMYPRPKMATADPTTNPSYYNQYYGGPGNP